MHSCVYRRMYIYLVPSSQSLPDSYKHTWKCICTVCPRAAQSTFTQDPQIYHTSLGPLRYYVATQSPIPVPNASSLEGKPPTVSGHLSRPHTYPYLPRTSTRCTWSTPSVRHVSACLCTNSHQSPPSVPTDTAACGRRHSTFRGWLHLPSRATRASEYPKG